MNEIDRKDRKVVVEVVVNNLYLVLQDLKRSGLYLPRGHGEVLPQRCLAGLLDGPKLIVKGVVEGYGNSDHLEFFNVR